MQIEDFKRWHWIVIAIVVGALMGMMWNMSTPDEANDGRGMSAFEFVGNVARPKTGNGYPWIRQTVVYPPQDRIDPETRQKVGEVNYVVCAMLKPLPNGKYKYEVNHFTADIPFKVGNIQPKSATYSIRDYLAETRAAFPDVVNYKYAWWAAPKAKYALWMGGMLVLIGGIWPSLVNLMIGAGMGKPHREKKEEYDLSRFGKSTSEKAKVPPKPGMSTADNDKLRDLQEQLASNVSGMELTPTGEAASAAGSTAPSTTVKKLTGAADPTPAVVSTNPDEPKEYTGEYYPVVKPHHQEDTKKPEAGPVGR